MVRLQEAVFWDLMWYWSFNEWLSICIYKWSWSSCDPVRHWPAIIRASVSPCEVVWQVVRAVWHLFLGGGGTIPFLLLYWNSLGSDSGRNSHSFRVCDFDCQMVRLRDTHVLLEYLHFYQVSSIFSLRFMLKLHHENTCCLGLEMSAFSLPRPRSSELRKSPLPGAPACTKVYLRLQCLAVFFLYYISCICDHFHSMHSFTIFVK